MEGCRYRGRERLTFHDQINRCGHEMSLGPGGKVKSLQNRHACLKRVGQVYEAVGVCYDRDIWRSILSAYPYWTRREGIGEISKDR